jgi:protein-S-isoprenylcysteine O-methyltransferase Ste14
VSDAPNTASRLRLTYVFYLALASAAAVAGQPYSLNPILNQTIDGVSVLLVFSACLGRIWCSAFIGGYKSTALITEGPYSVARHPLYSFSWLGALGLGLATHSILLTFITAVFFAVLFSHAARREDSFLAATHSDPFTGYARSTPRFWPRWRKYRVAESLTIKPAILRKSFLDAGAFIILYLAIDSLRVLRESGLLPTLCQIP